jgi:hypothetical protein
MSEPAGSSSLTPANWVLSVAGVLGSLLIAGLVLTIAYVTTHPTQTVDAAIVADRKAKLAAVQAAEASLYNNYSWVDQPKGVVRIPVELAMQLAAQRLSAATVGEPPAPERLSLAASPEAITPVPPPSATK